MTRRRFAISALVFAVAFSVLHAQIGVQDGAATLISSEEVYSFCKTLSAPRFAGRYTSTDGYVAAANWVASKLKEWRLRPYSDKEGYLQPYPCPYTLVDEAEMTLLLPEKKDGADKNVSYTEVKLAFESEFMPFLFSDSGAGTADIVFAGWGISAPDLGYDDYANVDVKGKFVMLFRGSPGSDDPRLQEWMTKNRQYFVKIAQQKGALGILYVYSKEPIAYPGKDLTKGFCPFMISETIVDKLLEEKHTTFSRLKQDLLSFKKPISFPLAAKVRYGVKSRHFPDGMSYNVIGYVEGSDARLKKECLFMFAHLDHAGSHAGRMFLGAHDNASGSAVVMELAKAFSTAARKPKRSVIFVLFTAEEIELGTSYFTKQLPAQFEKVDATFDYDMVGVGDYVNLRLDSQPPEFKKLVLDADRTHIVRESTGSQTPGGQGQAGVPNLYFASGGGHTLYQDYHRSADTIYRINPEIMADIARLSFETARAWADR